MNKDEKMIEEMAIIISGSTELDTMNYYSARYKAKALIDAGYRKVADDEQVIKTEQLYETLNSTLESGKRMGYAKGRDETAREILEKFKTRIKSIPKNNFTRLEIDWEIAILAQKYGIELE